MKLFGITCFLITAIAAFLFLGIGIAIGANASSLPSILIAFSFAERFQTLLAGLFGSIAAFASVTVISSQIKLQRSQHSSDKKFALRHEKRANTYAFQLGEELRNYDWDLTITNGHHRNNGRPYILASPENLLADHKLHIQTNVAYWIQRLQSEINYFNSGQSMDVYVVGEETKILGTKEIFDLIKSDALKLAEAASAELKEIEEMSS